MFHPDRYRSRASRTKVMQYFKKNVPSQWFGLWPTLCKFHRASLKFLPSDTFRYRPTNDPLPILSSAWFATVHLVQRCFNSFHMIFHMIVKGLLSFTSRTRFELLLEEIEKLYVRRMMRNDFEIHKKLSYVMSKCRPKLLELDGSRVEAGPHSPS